MISVIIPTYKNKWSFLHNLKNNLPHLKDAEIIAINDNPKINLKDDLKPFKNIILIENAVNCGFGESVNKGVKKAKNRFVMLLNDDVILQDNSYLNMLTHFRDQKLFAVGFRQQEKNNIYVGKNRILWKRGLFFHSKAKNLSKGETAWVEGGACLIDRNKFIELHGFDSRYAPFYWEDIDLSYCAWKSGYTVLFDPSVTVIHHHESTIGAHFEKKFINTIAFRNQFLFMWKNITDSNLTIRHWSLLPFNLIYYLLKGKLEFFSGLLKAMPFLFTMKRPNYPLSDKEILAKFK